MKIVVVHNRYRQAGGEDAVFEAETALLAERGHRVVRHVDDNARIRDGLRPGLAAATIWNPRAYRTLRRLFRRERPDVVHFHNTFPLVSPAAYWAARAEGAAVVQTLHNYRLLCPMGQLVRDGGVCEDCVGRRVAWPGVLHACYRGSRPATAAAAAMISVHRALGTWSDRVDRYVALTDFAREKFIQGGLPAERIRVKPNFVAPDPGVGRGRGGYALFVGRLAPEKGVETMLAAWERIGGGVPLKVAGDGPAATRVAAAAARTARIEWLGWRPAEEIQGLMGDALALVFPSEWYEGFPRVLVEAFARGLPVVASDLGGMAEIVDDGRTGLRFPVGDAAGLAARIERLAARPDELARMRSAARREYETRYTADRNYERLMEIYEEARAGTSDPVAAAPGVAGGAP